MPFHVISYKMAAKLKADCEKEFNIKFLARTSAFKTPRFLKDSYEEGLRRFSGKDDPIPYALRFSKYEELYRHFLMKDSSTIAAMRQLYTDGKAEDIYLVNEWKNTPEMEVLLEAIRVRGSTGVWG